MKVLEDIKELLEEELKEIKKRGTFTPAELEVVHKSVETIKLIDEICEEDENKEYEKEYSGRMSRMYSGHRMPMMPTMLEDRSVYRDDGYTYGGYSSNGPRSGDRVYTTNYSGCYSGTNTNRDSMGRYSREGATSHMIGRLEEMLNNACSERERDAIRSCIDKLSW